MHTLASRLHQRFCSRENNKSVRDYIHRQRFSQFFCLIACQDINLFQVVTIQNNDIYICDCQSEKMIIYLRKM